MIRYYVHGDVKGDNYYCQDCDVFVEIGHDHEYKMQGNNNYKRYRSSLKFWKYNRKDMPGYFRPDNVENVFSGDA